MNEPNNAELDFKLLWERYPEKQNWSSSVWWFYLLFPKGEAGFSREQMMFAILSRVGSTVLIDGLAHPGLSKRVPPPGQLKEQFPGMTVGWMRDRERLYPQLIAQPAPISLEPGQVTAWHESTGYGGEIKAVPAQPFRLYNRFRGAKGEAEFECWGSPDSPITRPAPFDRQTIFGQAHVLAWRHSHFAGDFTAPDGRRRYLQGTAYFQRISLNIVPFPWKWIWAVFEDETVFSCFIPYLGPHLLRRGSWFFPHWLEQATWPIYTNAYLSRSPDYGQILFDRVEVRPHLNRGADPDFQIECRNGDGDRFSFLARTHTHATLLLERPLWGHRFKSHYNYNEYLFKIEQLQGNIEGQSINSDTFGPGFGNCEYTWGLGL